MHTVQVLTRRSELPEGIIGWICRHFWGRALAILAKILSSTVRYQYLNIDYLNRAKEASGPFAVALWHQNSFAATLAHQNQAVAVLVSPDDWGEYLSRFLRMMGLSSIRGKKVKQRSVTISNLPQDELARKALAITVDGPFGPQHEVKAGVVSYAQSRKVPILPIAAVADRYWELKSWDRQRIPKPFSKVRVLYGAPIDTIENGGVADLRKPK